MAEVNAVEETASACCVRTGAERSRCVLREGRDAKARAKQAALRRAKAGGEERNYGYGVVLLRVMG
jgi:hypothetical protein